MAKKAAKKETRQANPRLAAGKAAERQMNFYLHRAFAADPDFFLINDLRLVDDQQPEHDGSPGVCQIDHLLIHPRGAFIVESKSVIDEVAVRDDGSGGDEWTRKYRGREHGFPSPIQQACRQGEFLRRFLQRHREELLGKAPTGLRTITKLAMGTDQRGFTHMPIQIIVAISDSGKIARINRWTEPTTPFRTYVCKADLVTIKIQEELDTHKAANKLLGEINGSYGVWAMKPEEVGRVAEFLAANHRPAKAVVTSADPVASEPRVPPKAEPVQNPASQDAPPRGPACQSCAGVNLTASWGKFGYYWNCADCKKNTTMPTICSACSAQGERGKVVRIRKEGPKYYRSCERCGIEERIWTHSES